MSRTRIVAWSTLLLVVAAGCGTAPSAGPVGDRGEAVDFAAAVPTFDGDIEVYDGPGELAASVDLVVRGRIEEVSPGRRIVFDPVNVPDDVTETVVFRVAVDEVVSGDAGREDVVYVEVHVTEQLDLEAVRRAAPDDAMLFLTVLPEELGPDVAIEDADDGRPRGSRLYGVSPAGFLYLERGELEDLHVELEELPGIWTELASLDEVEDDVESAELG